MDEVRIKVAAEDQNLGTILDIIEEKINEHDCSYKVGMNITIAVEELFTNVAHYAYEGKTGEVEVIVQVEDGTISVTLIDEGMEFNPLSLTDPDLTLSVEERGIGGLGIYMVKKSMDEFTYSRLDNKNIVTIKKKLV